MKFYPFYPLIKCQLFFKFRKFSFFFYIFELFFLKSMNFLHRFWTCKALLDTQGFFSRHSLRFNLPQLTSSSCFSLAAAALGESAAEIGSLPLPLFVSFEEISTSWLLLFLPAYDMICFIFSSFSANFFSVSTLFLQWVRFFLPLSS